MGWLSRLWHGFVRLFGLNTCPTPPAPSRPRTPRERAVRERLERVLERG